jgi:Flp pilus assembly protein TadD
MHVPFQLDDTFNISDKLYVRDISSFLDPVKIEQFRADGPYRMRTGAYFTLAVNYMLHGDDVVGYHVVNIVIHVFNGFLVYILALLTFRTPYFSSQLSSVSTLFPHPSSLIPFAAALLFACHPVQTQAVTYIVQRAASMATLFCLLSLVMYIKGRLASQRKVEAKGKVEKESDSNFQFQSSALILTSASTLTFFVLSFLSAVIAMKSKEIAFTLPLTIALYEFLFFRGTLKKRFLYLIPFLLTMLIIPLELMGLEGPAGKIIGDVSEAVKVQTDISRWDYLFTEFRVIVTYIRLLFFPVNQNLDYDYPIYHAFFDPNVFLSFLFLLILFSFGIYCLYRSRISHPSTLNPQPSSRLAGFGILWFFITLSVESSVIPIVDVIFEHRLYLPSAGFFIAVATGGFVAWERVAKKDKASLLSFPDVPVPDSDQRIGKPGKPLDARLLAVDMTGKDTLTGVTNDRISAESRKWLAKIIPGMFGVIIIILLCATYARNNLWTDEVKLWQDVVKKSPSKVRARSNLGHFYGKRGRFEDAFREYQVALGLDPDDFQVHNNLGVIYKAQGRIEEAIREYQTALRLNPDDAFSYYNLGNIFREKGDFEKAIEHYLSAIRLDPEVAIIHNNLGIAYIGQGNPKEAEREFRIAIDLDPKFEPARRNLETLLSGEVR